MRLPWWSFLIFLTIFLTIYGGTHLYIYVRLIQPLKLSRGWNVFVKISYIFLLLSFPLIHFIARTLSGPLIRTINYGSSVWMGVVLYLFLFIFLFDVVTVFSRLFAAPISLAPQTKALLIASMTILITGYGLFEAGSIGITRLPVAIANLPKNLAGFKIVQISDVHMGLTINGGFLDKIAQMTNALDPDLIVITGDLLDEQAFHIEAIVEPLKKLKSRHGIFAVTGNHEYLAGIHRAVSFIEKAGITLLRNRWTTVAGGLQLLGRDDPAGKYFTGVNRPPLTEIMKGLNPNQPIIFLNHTPDTTLEELEKHGIQLQFSGHTHQGQLWPFNYIVKLFFKTYYGLFKNDQATIYVSRGIGTWGPPMRVLAPPEITLITLTGKAENSGILP